MELLSESNTGTEDGQDIMGGHRGSTLASPGMPARRHDSHREETRRANPATPTPHTSQVGPSEEVSHPLRERWEEASGRGTAYAKAIQESGGIQ